MSDAPTSPPKESKRNINWTAVLTLLTAVVGLLTALIAFLRETNGPAPLLPATATATAIAINVPSLVPSPTRALTRTPTPIATTTRAATTPAASPAATAINGTASFGTVRDLNGLLAVVGNPDLAAGCEGTLDFELTLTNTTTAAIVLGFNPQDVKLSGDGQTVLSVFGDAGLASPRCYSSFTASTLAPGAAATYALRTRNELTRFKYIDVTFSARAGRLADQTWRLDLSTAAKVPRPAFGQTLTSADGIEVTTSQENYFPGCNGSLGFALTLRNIAGRAVALMLSSSNLQAYGDSKRELGINSQLGAPTAECYSNFNLPSLNAGQTATLAVRLRNNLADFTYVDIVFEGTTRLAGLRWRLQLPR